jgi:hypothetical protein
MALLQNLGRTSLGQVIAEPGRSSLSARANALLIYANRSSLRTATVPTTATGSSTNMVHMLLSFDRGHIFNRGLSGDN